MREPLEYRQLLFVFLSRTGTLLIEGTKKTDLISISGNKDIIFAVQNKTTAQFALSRL